MFELRTESHTSVTVLRYFGDMCLPEVALFSKQLESILLEPGISQVVLDLSHVDRVDNSGLGVLVSASTKGRGRGRRLVLLAPAAHVAELLRKVEIEGFFPTFDCEEELQGSIPDTAS